MKSYLVLENGKVFEGIRIGSKKDAIFNIVMNTGNTRIYRDFNRSSMLW